MMVMVSGILNRSYPNAIFAPRQSRSYADTRGIVAGCPTPSLFHEAAPFEPVSKILDGLFHLLEPGVLLQDNRIAGFLKYCRCVCIKKNVAIG